MLLPKHEDASPAALVSYLNGVKDVRQNAPCVSFAIKKIGEQEYLRLQFNRAFAPENHPARHSRMVQIERAVHPR